MATVAIRITAIPVIATIIRASTIIVAISRTMMTTATDGIADITTDITMDTTVDTMGTGTTTTGVGHTVGMMDIADIAISGDHHGNDFAAGSVAEVHGITP